MSRIRVYAEDDPSTPLIESDRHREIRRHLEPIGVRFERWPVRQDIGPGDPAEEVLQAYADEVEALKAEGGYVIVDVVGLTPDHPEKAVFREKFLAEHTHAEDEIRYFAAGEGLFTLHVDDRVYEVLCTAGDLIGVPANTRHWFDMGPNPSFCAIRFFQDPDGWVGEFTGSDIAGRFSRLQN